MVTIKTECFDCGHINTSGLCSAYCVNCRNIKANLKHTRQ